MERVTRPTLGTPAVPIEATVAVATTVARADGVRSMPYACAMKITATPCMIEVPSMLMVAPSGMVKEDILLDTPIFLNRVSMDSGIVALLVEVENAKVMTGKNFLINLNGFSLVKRNNST